jgi:lysophospholipase L1-like esterase
MNPRIAAISKKGLVNVSLVVGAALLALLTLEAALRILKPKPKPNSSPLYLAHPHMLYTGNPALSAWYNSAGFGDDERVLRKRENLVRIACAGGSTTFGKHNWPLMLDRLLREVDLGSRESEVLNFGLPGYTTLESMIALAIKIQDYDPDYLIIHHALNDIMPRLYPRMESDYGHFRKPLRYELGAIHRYLLSKSYLYFNLRRRLGWRLFLVHETMTVHDRKGDNLYTPDYLNPDTSIFERNLKTMIAVARGANIAPILTTEPYSVDPSRTPKVWSIDHELKVKGMRQHNDVIRRVAEERKVLFVDLDKEMTGNEGYFNDHVHCSPRGRMKKAEMLRDLLIEEITASKEDIP